MLDLKNVKENLEQLTKKYNLLVNNNHYLLDGDLEELFSDSNIVIGDLFHKAQKWEYGEDGWLVGCQDGDYLETIQLIQNGNVYLCQAFSDCCGEGLDYMLALANVSELEILKNEMRFEDIELENLDINLGNGEYDGNYVVPATDELIDITNKIRAEQGNTDLVGVEYENDVYYTFYLNFNSDKKEISLEAEVAHGEKDDYVFYTIGLSPEEKEMLLWKVVRGLLIEIENC